jgi:hypothetical protein
LTPQIVYAALILCMCGIGSCQVHRPPSPGERAQDKYSVSNLPTIDLTHIEDIRSSDSHSQAESRRQIRYGMPGSLPLYSPSTKRAVFGELSVSHLDRDPLPVQSADLIVIGTVTSIKTHVSNEGAMLYSTFSFVPEKILKNKAGQLRSALTLERIGG